MKHALTFLLVSLTFISCKKEEAVDNRLYSTWYINGQKFTTNEVRIESSMGAMGWYGYIDGKQAFGTTFVHYIAAGQDLTISEGYKTQSSMSFSYKGDYYAPSKDTFFTIHPINVSGKIQFNIDTEKFYNYRVPLDSVVIWGTFSEP